MSSGIKNCGKTQLQVNGRIFFDFAKSAFPNRTKRWHILLPLHALENVPAHTTLFARVSFLYRFRSWVMIEIRVGAFERQGIGASPASYRGIEVPRPVKYQRHEHVRE